MPRLPGQPPGLDVDPEPPVLSGAVLDATTVAESCFFVCTGAEDWGVVVSTSEVAGVVAGIGMTVTVDGEGDDVSEDDATVVWTAEVEVTSGAEVGMDETSGVEVSVTGAFEELLEGVVELALMPVKTFVTEDSLLEGVVELSLMPVKTLVTEDSLEMGRVALDDGVVSEVLSSAGVTVTVTMGFSVTVTAPESQEVESTALTLEPPGLPAWPT